MKTYVKNETKGREGQPRTPDNKPLSNAACNCVAKCANRDSDSEFCRCQCHRASYEEIARLKRELNAEQFRHRLAAFLAGPDRRALWLQAMALTHSPAQADELVQQSAARALDHAERFDPSKGLLPWLSIILRNCFRDDKRSFNSRMVSLFSGTDAKDGRPVPELVHTFAESEPTPEQVLLDSEAQGLLVSVLDAVAALPRDRRDLVASVVMGGESYESAARRLRIPLGTLRSRISRVLAELRARCQK